MSKKIKVIIAVTTLISLVLVGCSKAQEVKSSSEKIDRVVLKTNDASHKKLINRFNFKDLGFQFYVNDTLMSYIKNRLVYIGASDYPNDFIAYFITSDDLEESNKKKEPPSSLDKYRKNLFLIKVVDKNNDVLQSNIKELEKIYAKKDKIGEVGDLSYYIWYNDKFDTSNLSQKAQKEVKDILEGLEFIKKNIDIFEQVNPEKEFENLKKFEFKGKTLDGKDIDEKVFKDNKITMINIWAVNHSSEQELNDVEKFYEDIKNQGGNVIGIVLNGDEEVSTKDIITYNDIHFNNIVLDKNEFEKIDKIIEYLPMKIFVDRKGTVLGKSMIGEDYKTKFDELIKNIK